MEEVRKQGVESLFCPYEQALKLKELEFDEECLASYHNTKIIGYEKEYWLVLNEDSDQFLESTFICKAPLWQQAFDWFREKHNLEASIQRMPPEVYGKGKGDIKNYLLYIWAENLNPRGQQTLHFDTYEEAEFECLKKLIEIVKKQNVK